MDTHLQAGFDLESRLSELEEYTGFFQAQAIQELAELNASKKDPLFWTVQTTHPEVLEGGLEEARKYLTDSYSAHDAAVFIRERLKIMTGQVDDYVAMLQEKIATQQQLIQLLEDQLCQKD